MNDTKTENKKNRAAGHRDRVKKRFASEGLANFQEHEILEMLLFFSIPQIDTKDLAKSLIEEFGSLNAVINADIEELKTVKGIGQNSAILINFIKQLSRVYSINQLPKRLKLDTKEKVFEYCKSTFLGSTNEQIRILCLDDNLYLLKDVFICEGTPGGVKIDTRQIVMAILKHKCERAILTHCHPIALCQPSKSDISATRRLNSTLSDISITLEDHIIVGNDGVFSLRLSGRMPDVWM